MEKGKDQEDKRRKSKRSSVEIGHSALMQNLLPGNKLQTTYMPKNYVVVSGSGPRATVEDRESGKSYDRNVAHLKKLKDPVVPPTSLDSGDSTNEANSELNVASSEDEFYGFEEELPSKTAGQSSYYMMASSTIKTKCVASSTVTVRMPK
ncbi:AAEL003207-PA [Aedes aegypti]|uniref:AAEL003207-PA n=1 Tax=Aedes aegypti TaxID=7159 RepID=Q17G57_AEDAE|nr:AAEL003207-PA [Aedes aegypti]